MFDQQVALSVVKILTLMSSPPNLRSRPAKDDLAGDFDVWFDGGAAKHVTGHSTYRFRDGATAVTGTNLGFSVTIQLGDGDFVHVRQLSRESLHPFELMLFDAD